jgi:hypothetical protein
MRVIMRKGIIVALLLAATAAPAYAQMATDDQLLYLEVKQAQVAFEAANQRWTRAERLAHDGLISTEQTATERTTQNAALVAYQRALLKLIDTLPHLGIVSATKYQDDRGRKHVRLVLKNDTPQLTDTEFAPLLGIGVAGPGAAPRDSSSGDPVLGDFMRIRDLSNIFVSLKDIGDALPSQSAFVSAAQQIVIGKPYEARIDRIAFGAQATLDFELLKDVENVIVSMRKNSRSQDLPIKLEYDAQRSAVTVNTSQASQEANLGTQVVYDLLIERGAGGNQTLRLATAGLPTAIRAEFVDPETQARLSQLTLLAGTTSQRLRLRLFMPEKSDSTLTLDKPLVFQALLSDAAVDLTSTGVIDAARARSLGIGWAQLEVVPRGLGEITVNAPTLYYEVQRGQRIDMPLTVRNTGTRGLDNIQFTLDLPPGWTATLTPDNVRSLLPNKEESVHAVIELAHTTGVGEFEVRLQTRCSTDNRPLQVEDKRVRVNVVHKANVAGTTIIVLLVLGLLGSIVAVGIRMTRR